MAGTIASDEMTVTELVSIASILRPLLPNQIATETTIIVAGRRELMNDTKCIMGKRCPSNACIQRLILWSTGK